MFPEYEVLVLHQNVERFDSNSAKNHNCSWQAKRENKKFCPNFLIFLKFRTLEGTVVMTYILYLSVVFLISTREMVCLTH